MKHYSNRDARELDRQGGFFTRHMSAMSDEGLRDKSDIAAELAHRDSLLEDERERADALAAHLKRVTRTLDDTAACMRDSKVFLLTRKKMSDRTLRAFDSTMDCVNWLLYSAPKTSLARHDNQVRAEALWDMANRLRCDAKQIDDGCKASAVIEMAWRKLDNESARLYRRAKEPES